MTVSLPPSMPITLGRAIAVGQQVEIYVDRGGNLVTGPTADGSTLSVARVIAACAGMAGEVLTLGALTRGAA